MLWLWQTVRQGSAVNGREETRTNLHRVCGFVMWLLRESTFKNKMRFSVALKGCMNAWFLKTASGSWGVNKSLYCTRAKVLPHGIHNEQWSVQGRQRRADMLSSLFKVFQACFISYNPHQRRCCWLTAVVGSEVEQFSISWFICQDNQPRASVPDSLLSDVKSEKEWNNGEL